MATFLTEVCLVFVSVQEIIGNSQPGSQIYFDDFSSQNDWTIDNIGKGTIGAQWENSGDTGRCNKLSGPICLFLPGQGLVSRVISTAGYHTIKIYIDVRSAGNEGDEYCYLQYRALYTSWTRINLLEGVKHEIETVIPDTDDYNNQSSFQLSIGHSGDSGGDLCFFDNLTVFGTAFADSLASNPTAPTLYTFGPPTEWALDDKESKDPQKSVQWTGFSAISGVVLGFCVFVIVLSCIIFRCRKRKKLAIEIEKESQNIQRIINSAEEVSAERKVIATVHTDHDFIDDFIITPGVNIRVVRHTPEDSNDDDNNDRDEGAKEESSSSFTASEGHKIT